MPTENVYVTPRLSGKSPDNYLHACHEPQEAGLQHPPIRAENRRKIRRPFRGRVVGKRRPQGRFASDNPRTCAAGVSTRKKLNAQDSA